MNGFFNEKGNEYLLKDKKTKFPLYNYHFNDSYYMTVANTMFGDSRGLEPFEKTWNRSFRYCFIKDKEQIWSLGNTGCGCNVSADSECVYKLHSTQIIGVNDGLKVSAELFVPLRGMGEFHIYTFENITSEEKIFQAALVNSLEDGAMGAKCIAGHNGQLISSEVIPYHIYYDDYYKAEKECNITFSVVSDKPQSVCCSEYVLFDGTEHNVSNVFDSVNYPVSDNGKPVSAFLFHIKLRSGEKKCIWTYSGLCTVREQAQNIAERLLKNKEIAQTSLREVRQKFETLPKKFSAGDRNLDNFASFWAKKQVLCMGITQRMSKSYCIRNVLQDAMGLMYVDRPAAREYLRKALSCQLRDGSIRQHGVWGDVYPKRGLALLYMRDGPSWLVVCTSVYLNDSGDDSFLDELVPYKDGGEASVAEHLLKAVDFMWRDRGMFGLSLLGDGDWTDPINGPGRKGKGVSTWTSMAFVCGMRALLKVLRRTGQTDKIAQIEQKIAEMDKNISERCFLNDQFVAGFDDEGKPYGGADSEEGNLFLNMHSWAIISGVAKGAVKDRCIKIIKSMANPCGIRVMQPPYTKWNAQVGKISVKRAGTTENGSVYCHASMFAVYALFMSGEREFAEKCLKDILPTHDYQADFDTQVPIFIPNYYFGLQNSPQFGRSSAVNSTGSASWYLKIYRDFYEGKYTNGL